jgi:hypothetical protein
LLAPDRMPYSVIPFAQAQRRRRCPGVSAKTAQQMEVGRSAQDYLGPESAFVRRH